MDAHSQATDHELVQASLRDPDAFAFIVRRYERPLSRYLARLMRGDAEGQRDVLQNVFIKVYERLNDVDPALSFSSWLYRIAHNEAIDALRRETRGSVPESALASPDDDDDAGILDRFAADVDVAADVDRDRLRADIRKVLARLPPNYRDVLILRFFEEKSYAEMADILKRPLGTISILIYRAKRVFRKTAAAHGVPIEDL